MPPPSLNLYTQQTYTAQCQHQIFLLSLLHETSFVGASVRRVSQWLKASPCVPLTPLQAHPDFCTVLDVFVVRGLDAGITAAPAKAEEVNVISPAALPPHSATNLPRQLHQTFISVQLFFSGSSTPRSLPVCCTAGSYYVWPRSEQLRSCRSYEPACCCTLSWWSDILCSLCSRYVCMQYT